MSLAPIAILKATQAVLTRLYPCRRYPAWLREIQASAASQIVKQRIFIELPSNYANQIYIGVHSAAIICSNAMHNEELMFIKQFPNNPSIPL